MSGSNCCSLNCIQVSQEVVWYPHLFKNFPVFVIQTVKGFGVVFSFYRLGNLYANEWGDYFSYFGEGVEISRNRATAHSEVLGQCLGTVTVPLCATFSLLTQVQGLIKVDPSAIWDPFDYNQFMWCPWAM